MSAGADQNRMWKDLEKIPNNDYTYARQHPE